MTKSERIVRYTGAEIDDMLLRGESRTDWARVDGFGLDGGPVTFEGDGLLARCLQHETDHTLGTVFGDRLSAKSRKRLTKKHDAAAEDYPLTWPTDESA